VAESSSIWSDLTMNMDACLDCHQQKAAKTECSTCHRELTRDTPPSSHTDAWTIEHGPHWRAASGDRTIDRCTICHTQGSCDDCHLNERPRSHNQYWRSRGHGLLAGIDRSRCNVCHTRDVCDACHSTERPMSHRASFGSPTNQHCYSCHQPLGSSSSCSVCHISTPSHSMAPPLPTNSTHQTATEADCRTCHSPLPHPDNGDSCRSCHH
jgi:hypothetical protein